MPVADDEPNPYDDDIPVASETPPPAGETAAVSTGDTHARRQYNALRDELELVADAQDNFVEHREPAELIFCIILSAAYAGLARYCWEPLTTLGQVKLLVTVEGFFITISLLSLLLGLRPYLSPSKLQISTWGVKYRGPYWPQRKTVNWTQMFRLYVSPQLTVVLYHPPGKTKGVRLLIIQSSYLSDSDHIVESFSKYSPTPPTWMKNPDWITKGVLFTLYGLIIAWILTMMLTN